MGRSGPAAGTSVFDADVEWRPIAQQARTLWTVGAIAVTVVVGLPVAAAAAVGAGLAGFLAVVVVGAVVIAITVVLIGRRWRAWGYAERDADLLVRRGLIIRRLSIVPYGRMQFVDVTQGPLDRMLGVAKVKLHTASASSDAEVPLLPEAEARRLRDRLTALGEAHAAGV